MKTPAWRGVFPAATTLFHDDESLDLPATLDHLDRMLAAGVHGMVILGTVGENCSLSSQEKRTILAASAERIAGRVPLLAGVAETTTRQACAFAADAQKAGLDGLMVLPAMVYKSDARETVAHFRAVARASDLPIMIYNNPISYSVDISPETFVEMADEKKFVAIKESSEDPRRFTDLRNLCGNRYTLFCGVDDLLLECAILGAEGWISGLVNAFPDENAAIWDCVERQDWNRARELYRWYTPLLHLDTHVKLVQYIKLAQADRGFGNPTTRAPRLPLAGAERDRVLKVIRDGIATRPGAAK
jgi:1-pyrroline-4-hydroxy-2-carboxylate deaminase